MKWFKYPKNTDKIDIRKRIGIFNHGIELDAKPAKCILCERESTSFCNSHSVPRVVLQNIAEDGHVLNANALIGLPFVDESYGVKKSGTFHYICRDCDSKIFQDYENNEALLKYPDDRVLAEIALKNIVHMLSKRNYEFFLAKKGESLGRLEGRNILLPAQLLDIRDYTNDMRVLKKILNDNSKNNFRVVYWKKLGYTIPMAAQSLVALIKDIEGNMINNIFDMSPNIRIQNLHIGVFPLENESVIMMFYHKRDKKYFEFEKQFQQLDENEKLEYINYLIFQYTENYFFKPSIKHILKKDKLLRRLSRQYNGKENLGIGGFWARFRKAKVIKKSSVTNILALR